MRSGEGKVTVTLGDASTAKSGSCTITIAPQIFATFYGEAYANMPYLETRPGKEILPMYFAYTYEKEMDINTSDTIRIAMNVQSGLKEDIENAYSAYRWEIASGSSVVITSKTNEYVENEGFDAVLSVRAGVEEGDTEIHCITPDTVFVATFRVKRFQDPLSGRRNYRRQRSHLHACGGYRAVDNGCNTGYFLCLS